MVSEANWVCGVYTGLSLRVIKVISESLECRVRIFLSSASGYSLLGKTFTEKSPFLSGPGSGRRLSCFGFDVLWTAQKSEHHLRGQPEQNNPVSMFQLRIYTVGVLRRRFLASGLRHDLG